MATIGVELQTRTPTVDHKTIKAQIWNSAGLEGYRVATSAYDKGAIGAMLVYNMTKHLTIDYVARWLEELHSYVDKNIFVMLIGNKSDLSTLRAFLVEDVKEFVHSKNLIFMEIFALKS
ncbi:hypothetical protein HPP92_015768 [Vanilla planifolia]|uniref:Uncharacterized protein n=1 Tax=Vanilla planifolia TaxID=51239 RepID=A0A835QMY0_VANPL|nr:hypothetical protein HPP92_015768 [Vanilla planifolia]